MSLINEISNQNPLPENLATDPVSGIAFDPLSSQPGSGVQPPETEALSDSFEKSIGLQPFAPTPHDSILGADVPVSSSDTGELNHAPDSDPLTGELGSASLYSPPDSASPDPLLNRGESVSSFELISGTGASNQEAEPSSPGSLGEQELPLQSGSEKSVSPESWLASFESGVFKVGATGDVSVDYLFDGGFYKGEIAIFSLRGMEQFEPGSPEFIKEAASRALSNSDLGYIVIADTTEGARFSGILAGEPNDWNAGTYQDAKTFAMRPGDVFGVMLPMALCGRCWTALGLVAPSVPCFLW